MTLAAHYRMKGPRALRPLCALGALCALALFSMLAASPTAAATVPNGFADQLVESALDRPTGLAFLPDGRLFFVEQISARVRLLVNGALAATDPVCTVPDVRTSGSNRGLYGIAVDPRWPQHPYLYVQHPTPSGKLSISRYTVTGDLAFTGAGGLSINIATRYQLFSNLFDGAHNGGCLRFGPDSMLYGGIGDSIASPCSAQDTVRMRGTILRIEVRNLPSGSGGPPVASLLTPPDNPFVAHPNPNARLVLATGLRNPFRFHIDPDDGALMIADVGEAAWEGINRLAGGGENFGWPLREGPDPFTSCAGAARTGLTGPIHVYDHATGITVIGVGLYRRPDDHSIGFPAEYDGDYFYADYSAGLLRRLKGSGASWSLAALVPGQPNTQDWGTGFDTITDGLVAADGSLWYCRQFVNFAPNSGEIRRIAFADPLGVEPGRPAAGGLEVRPLPARGRLHVNFTLSAASPVTLGVYDLAGRRVRRLGSATLHAAGPPMRRTGTDATTRVASFPPGCISSGWPRRDLPLRRGRC